MEEEGGGEGDDNKCCSGDALLKAWYILQMDWPIGYKKANYCIILEQFILLLLLYRYILLHMMINSSYALTVELIEICQWLFHNYVTHSHVNNNNGSNMFIKTGGINYQFFSKISNILR